MAMRVLTGIEIQTNTSVRLPQVTAVALLQRQSPDTHTLFHHNLFSLQQTTNSFSPHAARHREVKGHGTVEAKLRQEVPGHLQTPAAGVRAVQEGCSGAEIQRTSVSWQRFYLMTVSVIYGAEPSRLPVRTKRRLWFCFLLLAFCCKCHN